MTCYASEIETTGDTVGGWHDLESWYDSLTGKSPLMHLCRMCHDRSEAVYASEISFQRVGANPSDTAFSSVDYDSNPTWNPLRDINVILSQIHSRIAQLAGQSLDTDTCIKWYYIPTATVSTLYSAYNSAISGSSLPNKEDWLIYINAMKTFLEGLSGLDIESVAWAAGTGTIQPSTSAREGSVTSDVGGINTAGSGTVATVSGSCPPIGFTDNAYWTVTYNTDQEFGDVTWNASSSGAGMIGTLDLSVGIQGFDGSLNSGALRGETMRVPFPECSTLTEDDLFATYCGTGWFQVTKSKRRFTLAYSATGGVPVASLTGKTFNWAATLKEYDGTYGPYTVDSDIPHAFVGSGSGSFVVGSGGSFPAYIDVEVELDGDIIDAGADPFSGGFYEDGDIWIAKAGILILEITPDEYNYCKTGCNTYVEDV